MKIEAHLDEINKLKDMFLHTIETYKENIRRAMDTMKTVNQTNIDDSLARLERKDFKTEEEFQNTFSELMEGVSQRNEGTGCQWIYLSKASRENDVQEKIARFQKTQRVHAEKAEDALILLVSEVVKVIAGENSNKASILSVESKKQDKVELPAKGGKGEKKPNEVKSLVTKSNMVTSETENNEEKYERVNLSQGMARSPQVKTADFRRSQQPEESQSEDRRVDGNDQEVGSDEEQVIILEKKIEQTRAISKQEKVKKSGYRPQQEALKQINREEETEEENDVIVSNLDRSIKPESEAHEREHEQQQQQEQGREDHEESFSNNVSIEESSQFREDENLLDEKINVSAARNEAIAHNRSQDSHQSQQALPKHQSSRFSKSSKAKVDVEEEEEEVVRKEVVKQETGYDKVPKRESFAPSKSSQGYNQMRDFREALKAEFKHYESSPMNDLEVMPSDFNENTRILIETPGRFEMIQRSNHINVLKRAEKRFDAVAFCTKDDDILFEGFGFYCPKPLKGEDVNLEYIILDGVNDNAKVLANELITLERGEGDDRSVERILIKNPINLEKKRYYTVVLRYLDEVEITYGEGKWLNAGPFVFSGLTKKIVKHWLGIEYKLAEAEMMRSWQFPYLLYSKVERVDEVIEK